LHDLNLPEPVSAALLGGQGPYAAYLAIARACEDLNVAQIEDLVQPLRLTLADITCAQVEAMSWADNIGVAA
jgi:EAL and modified HD-GYP domain-containing signal transduction protein